MTFKTIVKLNILALVVFNLESCSKDDSSETNEIVPTASNPNLLCDNIANYVFVEKDGLIHVEFENALFPSNWNSETTSSNTSGNGYMVWNGPQNLTTPGTGLVKYKIKVVNSGTYRFIWKSAVKEGASGSDHNDTWLRFNDANDFYGKKPNSNSIVYPNGTGKTPNPNGSSSNGWFKIYRSGNDLDFKWQASTSDNDSHDIYVVFNASGTYTMEVSARSSGHAIDQFVLFKESDYTAQQATTTTTFSAIICQ